MSGSPVVDAFMPEEPAPVSSVASDQPEKTKAVKRPAVTPKQAVANTRGRAATFLATIFRGK